MPSKLRKAIGAVKDQTSISLAKVSNSSSNIGIAVLKATTHDEVPIDDRYINEVLLLISSDKAYAAACAQAIGKRIGRTRNWIVALKSLTLVLRIFQDGDPYFPREVLHAMKRGAKILNLSSFRDDSNSSPWDYTAFVRTFALYLDERLDCFLMGKLQKRFAFRDRDNNLHRSRRANEPVRDMKPAMLLDRISYWQRLLDRGIATQPTGAARTNRLVQIIFYAIVQESFDLYRDISDGLALLLDSFFHLQYQSCVNAFQTCVKASKQFEELCSFYSLCKSIGVGRTSEYPSVQKISDELIETLREFLKDQASFPANGKSPASQFLLSAPPSSRSRGSSSDLCDANIEQSELSEAAERISERDSDMGSRLASLEDLMGATDDGTSPPVSINQDSHLEQFEKQVHQEDFITVNDTRSSRSMAFDQRTDSAVDLACFDDWPQQIQKQEEEQEPKTSGTCSTDVPRDCWELVLFETATQSTLTPPIAENSFQSTPIPPIAENSFSASFDKTLFNQTQSTPTPPVAENSFSASFDSTLFNQTQSTPTPPNPIAENSFSASSDSTLINQTSLPHHHNNPFLQDPTEITATAVAAVSAIPTANAPATFSVTDILPMAPTFQAAPTFCANNPDGTTSFRTEDDPFAQCSTPAAGEPMLNGSVNQPNLLHEQQLWLQHQNKIIAKRLS